MTEFDTIYFHEIRGVILRVFHLIQHQNPPALRHRLHDQHTRHYRFFREVSHEERLVHGNVLATDHDVIRHLVNLVNQQERRTMRQQGSHLIHIHQRFGRRVHVGTNIFSLRLRDGLTHFLGQTGVCFVTRSLRDNTSFDKTPT